MWQAFLSFLSYSFIFGDYLNCAMTYWIHDISTSYELSSSTIYIQTNYDVNYMTFISRLVNMSSFSFLSLVFFIFADYLNCSMNYSIHFIATSYELSSPTVYMENTRSYFAFLPTYDDEFFIFHMIQRFVDVFGSNCDD